MSLPASAYDEVTGVFADEFCMFFRQGSNYGYRRPVVDTARIYQQMVVQNSAPASGGITGDSVVIISAPDGTLYTSTVSQLLGAYTTETIDLIVGTDIGTGDMVTLTSDGLDKLNAVFGTEDKLLEDFKITKQFFGGLYVPFISKDGNTIDLTSIGGIYDGIFTIEVKQIL